MCKKRFQGTKVWNVVVLEAEEVEEAEAEEEEEAEEVEEEEEAEEEAPVVDEVEWIILDPKPSGQVSRVLSMSSV